MRIASLVLVTAAFGTGAAAIAQQAPPAPQANEVPAPAVAAAPVSATTKVLVLSFEQMGGTAGNYDWIGRAVQQNLVTELGRVGVLELITPAQAGTRPVADAKAAIETGKAAGADVVVFGSYQLVEPDLRINGMVVDVATGETIGTLKSTGTIRDLFSMEDTVAMQARRTIVPPVYQTVDPAMLQQPAPTPQDQQQQQPQQVSNTLTPMQPPANSFAADYNRYVYYPNNAYGYGYYGYGYGYGGPGYGYGGPGYGYCPPQYPCYPSYYPGYGGYAPYYPVVINTQLGSFRQSIQRPIGVGTSAGMVASGLISVPGNFLPNGQLAK